MLTNLFSRLIYFTKDFYLYLILLIFIVLLTPIVSFKIYKTNINDNYKKLLIIFIFIIFSFSLIFSVCEFYFRYIYDIPDGLGFLKVNQKWLERHVNYTLHNKHLFRDENFNNKKNNKDALKIGIMGDSLTFGAGIENPNDRFSNQLSTKLKAVGINAQTYNLGVPGSDTSAEINTYKETADLTFDIVVWQYYLNDIQKPNKSTGSVILENNKRKAKIIEKISDKSYFFDYLYWKISAKHSKTINKLTKADYLEYRNELRFNEHKQEIDQFISELKNQNKKIVVIIFPSLFYIGPNYPAYDIHQKLNIIFKQNDVEVIDMLDFLKEKKASELIASPYDSHPNEYVHELAAEKLKEKVLKLLK